MMEILFHKSSDFKLLSEIDCGFSLVFMIHCLLHLRMTVHLIYLKNELNIYFLDILHITLSYEKLIWYSSNWLNFFLPQYPSMQTFDLQSLSSWHSINIIDNNEFDFKLFGTSLIIKAKFLRKTYYCNLQQIVLDKIVLLYKLFSLVIVPLKIWHSKLIRRLITLISLPWCDDDFIHTLIQS